LIVIDASAVLELLLRTEKGRKVEDRAFAPDEHLHAPHLMDIEVTQALRRLTLLNEITPTRARTALGDYAAILIKRSPHYDFLSRIWDLRDSVTAYDAAYVILAEALAAPLLTCDGKLARAHGHRAKIELIE
jgi:predicted nucleic acid-binding protein